MFWIPDASLLAGSNRIAADSAENGLLDGYFSKILDDELYKSPLLGVKLCFFMGTSFALAALRTAWSHMTGALRYHKAQFLLLICAVFIPGTEVLWHGGSHNVWVVRFAFLLAFAMLEILLVLRQQRLIDLSGEFRFGQQKTGKLFSAAVCLLAVCIYEVWSWNQITDDWNPLFVYTVISVLLWYLFYHVTLSRTFPKRNILLAAALSAEFLLHGLNWIAPSFCDSFHATQYIYPSAEISRELDYGSISSFDRTRDVDSRYHSNYASIMGTNSIGNFWGSIPTQLQEQYADLGYGRVWVRITDSGGTLFSDALLHVTSAFVTDRELEQEFYRKNPAVRTVHWYDCRYVLPVGIECRKKAAENFDESNVFAVQNRIFREITGKDEKLIREISVDSDQAKGMDVFIRGRKKLYFYGDFTYSVEKHAMDGISVNGEVFRIPDREDVQGTSYPSENNNRVLDLGTFENEKVHLKWEGVDEKDILKLHLGLFDVDKMKQTISEICERNTSSNPETGPDHVSLRHRAGQEGLLFLPMNYFEAWKCKVNGIPTEVKPVFGGFVGVPIQPGENEIRLDYVHSYPKSAWYLTCFSLMVGILLIRCRNKGLVMSRCRGLDYPLFALYGGLGALLFLTVYVIPVLMIGRKVIG